MEIVLGVIGVLTGFLSGFFGIGGGTFLVPSLLLLGFGIKDAIAISVLQMVFSSIVGSYFNIRNSSIPLKNALYLGVGGFMGALFSGYILSVVSEEILHYLFIAVVIFAIGKFFTAKTEVKPKEEKPSYMKYILVLVGFFVGIFSISLGVGGAILIGPIMAGFLGYSVKESVVYSLFFVIFSSIAGFISMMAFGHLNIHYGLLVGVCSLIGVYVGTVALKKVDAKKHKNYILILYLVILAVMVEKSV